MVGIESRNEGRGASRRPGPHGGWGAVSGLCRRRRHLHGSAEPITPTREAGAGCPARLCTLVHGSGGRRSLPSSVHEEDLAATAGGAAISSQRATRCSILACPVASVVWAICPISACT